MHRFTTLQKLTLSASLILSAWGTIPVTALETAPEETEITEQSAPETPANEAAASYTLVSGETVNNSLTNQVRTVIFGYTEDYADIIGDLPGTDLSTTGNGIRGYMVDDTYYILSDGTIKVTDATHMFWGRQYLQSIVFDNFDTSEAVSFEGMFAHMHRLESLDLSGLDTSSAGSMKEMFWNCNGLKSLDLSGWDTGNVTDMAEMFYQCASLETLVIPLNTSNVTDMSKMFSQMSKLQTVDLSEFDTSKVVRFSAMFAQSNGFLSLDLSGFDTSSATDMSDMFFDCENLQNVNVTGFDTSSVIRFDSMFAGCRSLEQLDVTGFDVSNAESLGVMFGDCSSLRSIDLSTWNTPKNTNLQNFFMRCYALEDIRLGEGFDTSKVTNMNSLFSECTALRKVDLSMFDMSSVQPMTNRYGETSENLLFYEVPNMEELTVGENFRFLDSRGLSGNWKHIETGHIIGIESLAANYDASLAGTYVKTDEPVNYDIITGSVSGETVSDESVEAEPAGGNTQIREEKPAESWREAQQKARRSVEKIVKAVTRFLNRLFKLFR